MQKCVFRWLDEDGHIDTIEETVYEIIKYKPTHLTIVAVPLFSYQQNG
jgi:hypothetical protein